jgi:hypothetical protein
MNTEEPSRRYVFLFDELFFILRKQKQINLLRIENGLETAFSTEFNFTFKISEYEIHKGKANEYGCCL